MNRRTVFLLGGAALVAACTRPEPVQVGSDGKPLPRLYQIEPGSEAAISFRMLDAINALRSARSAQPLSFNAALNAAAATHSRDMSVQNRPWHFGSDGSSPLTRVQRDFYPGKLLGELISETYQTELETLAAWTGQADTRDVLLDPRANQLGFAWYQEPAGKIWWTALLGSG